MVLCLGIVDPASGDLTLAGAGTEPPLILRASGANEVVRTDGSPLGVVDEAEFSVVRRHLERGDLLLLTTDGLTESRRAGAAGGTELLGYDGLTVLAQQSLPLWTLARVGEAIVAGARAFGSGRFRDDVCLLLARRS